MKKHLLAILFVFTALLSLTACGDSEAKPGKNLAGTWNLYSITIDDETMLIPESDPTRWASYTFDDELKNCFYTTYNADGDPSNTSITVSFPFPEYGNILEIKGLKGGGVFNAHIEHSELGVALVLEKWVDGKPYGTYIYRLAA